MKKNNKWLITIFTIFVFLCASCNNFLTRQTENKIEKTAAESNTGTLSFSLNGASSRSILPDTSIQNFSDFVLTGTVEGNDTLQALGSWDTVQELLSASISIDAGNWNLTLTAKRGSVNFFDSTEITIKGGGNATASFKLAASKTEKGIANITLRFPAKSEIYGVRWRLYDDNDHNSFWYYYGNDINGFCCKDESENDSDVECVQTLTDTSFSLKAELPAGRYVFKCYFEAEIGEVGEYFDFVVIQSGLESALDYTIDYFEFTGITEAVSTEQGMLLTVDIPKGVKNLSIMRITNYNALMQASNNPDPNAEPIDVMAYITLINKQLDTKTTSHTTLQLLDSYGYKADDELTYAVYFNISDDSWDSIGSVIKTYKTLYDGITAPEFITYPEFATESNDQGITTKIKITNNPIVDWKGNELTNGYKVYFGADSMDGGVFPYPKFAIDSTTKECVIEDNTLEPGQKNFNSYRFGLNNNGWDYSLYVNTKNLSGVQLPPVLQGPSPAQATDEGIQITLYGTYNHWSYMSILRADSPEGPWEVLQDRIDSDGGRFYIDYTDKYDLVAGTTYYYKVINEHDETFGGEYFSATATVTKGPVASITTQPVLSVSNDAVASFTPGTFQFAEPDDVNSVKTVFEYTQQGDSSNALKLYFSNNLQFNSHFYNGEFLLGEMNNKYFSEEDGTLDLYKYEVDGKKFIFSKAYIIFIDGDGDTIKQLDFTPAQGNYPTEIQIPSKKIGLSANVTEEGIVLSITNIPEGASSLYIRSSDARDNVEYGYNREYTYNNISSTTLTHTDKYIYNNFDYYYMVSCGNYRSDIISVTSSSTSGFGEIQVSNYPTGTVGVNEYGSIIMTYTQAAELTTQDFPDDTSWYLEFTYRQYNEYGGWSNMFFDYFDYAPYNPVYISYPSSETGTYIPVVVNLTINFSDYSYCIKRNVSSIDPMPSQIVIE